MRIHRTAPGCAISVFVDTLPRDRSISRRASAVLTYPLTLPNGARASLRTLAEQRGKLLAASEVFDTPYDHDRPAGEAEKPQNLATSA
jgi:hypothetical protein